MDTGHIFEQKRIPTVYEWKLYSSSAEAPELVESITGHRTHWCYRGILAAESFLSKGTIDLLYSHHDPSSENPLRPRAAIRTESGRIANIIGILPDETLEPEIVDIVFTQLGQYQDGQEKYLQAYQDFKALTQIAIKTTANIELNSDEVLLLYQVTRRAEQFGAHPDYRISEMIARRGITKAIQDISRALNIPPTSISTTINDSLQGGKIFHLGSLMLGSITNAADLNLPDHINGDLYLPSLRDSQGLILPSQVNGSLNLMSLHTLANVRLPQNIRGDMILGAGAIDRLDELKDIVAGSIVIGNKRIDS